MIYEHSVRIYYEDTDLGGVVYYANYLKFMERGRSEMLRELSIDQMKLQAETGVVFVVRNVEANYLKPAHFDDLLIVKTRILEMRRVSLVLEQNIWRPDGDVENCIFKATVSVVSVGRNLRPVELPKGIAKKI